MSASSAEHATTQGGERELGGVGDDVGLAVRTKRRGGPCDMVSVDTAEAFSQVIGCGEAEVADLVQILDPDVATRATKRPATPGSLPRHHLRSSRSRRPARQRSPCRFDRVDRVGLADAAAHLAVGTIDLDHPTPGRGDAERDRHRRHRCLPRQLERPARTPRPSRAARRTRSSSSRTTRHPTRRRSRRPPPRRAHPDAYPLRPSPGACSLRWSSPSLLSQTVKGWHARPGKETVTSTLLSNSELDHPPERGVPSSAHAPVDTHPTNLGAKQVRRTREPRDELCGPTN